MKLNNFFCLQEFLPKRIYDLPNSLRFIDPRLIDFALQIRLHTGKPVTINNWHSGGPLQFRGYRDPEYADGARLSMHRLGLALDFSIAGMFSAEVSNLIVERRDFWTFVKRLENSDKTPTWTHIDLKPTNSPEITIVDP